jgi:hypothetical protein
MKRLLTSPVKLLNLLMGVFIAAIVVFPFALTWANNTAEGAVTKALPPPPPINAPWEAMGTDVRQICSAVLPYRYEWGVQYNNSGPILRVTCNTWNDGWRVCTYPEYPTGDAQPFDWGGACWIWYTDSPNDDFCSIAYHHYFTQDAQGRLNMTGGNGCDYMPNVFRRRL